MSSKPFFYSVELSMWLWELTWIEHTSIRKKYVLSRDEPAAANFAKLKELPGFSWRDACKLKEILPAKSH